MFSFYNSLRSVIKTQCNSSLQPNHERILNASKRSSERDCLDSKQSVTMVDPKRVLSYDDMLKVIHHPKKVIIDVREPEEVQSTGQIPSSINIPLKSVHEVLLSMSHEDFRRQYRREKPASSDELIFYCKSGRRSCEALNQALKIGYVNSKTYLGSWTEWSKRKEDK